MIRFLVPVNFAPYTINALNFCSVLAEHLQGEITLLYSYTHLLSEDENPQQTHIISSKEDAMQELEELKKHVLKNHSTIHNNQVHLRLLDGYPEDTILEFSKEYHPDLILMGTKSKGETIKELLGSVTLDVVTKVHSPVMAVPDNYMVNISKLTNILFVTDFEQCEYTSLHKLVQLVGAFDTKIHNIQYCHSGKEKVEVDQLNAYNDYCKSTYRNQEMVCDYICGHDLIEASKEYIKEKQIDLMAITRKKRSVISKLLKPSVTKKVLFNAEIPTLFFHQ